MPYLLTQLLDATCERLAGKEAVRCNDTSLTYQELVTRSNQLAHVLREQGVAKGDRVGIYLSKSVESAVAIYGILKAGAAYVPLDPWAPLARLQYVTQDCGIRHLVTNPARRCQVEQLVEGNTLECIVGLTCKDDGVVRGLKWNEVYSHPGTTNPKVSLTEQAIAYILYTSGTTGQPKGMVHTHRSGLTFVDWATETYGLHADDRISNHAPLHFDLSIFDFIAAASVGATTCIVPEEVMKMPASLSKWIEDERVTVWYSVPVALTQLLLRGVIDKRDLSSLRWVLFGGEPIAAKHLVEVMQLIPTARFSHVYGVTELNVSHFYHVPQSIRDLNEALPIGKLCENMEALVLDESDRHVGVGQTGELVLRGPAMMRGYWKRPQLATNAYFRREGTCGSDETFYRTGDLVRVQSDDNYIFMGRRDRQVKIRGHRLELDEIEATLASHEGVEEAAVWAAPDCEGSTCVIAVAKLNSTNDSTLDNLVRHLRDHLPTYAIPSELSIVEKLPRTSAGKVDRQTLENTTCQLP